MGIVTLRMSAADEAALEKAAALLDPREATASKQVKRIIEQLPRVDRELALSRRRVVDLEDALGELWGSLAGLETAKEAVLRSEAGVRKAGKRAEAVLDWPPAGEIEALEGAAERRRTG